MTNCVSCIVVSILASGLLYPSVAAAKYVYMRVWMKLLRTTGQTTQLLPVTQAAHMAMAMPVWW